MENLRSFNEHVSFIDVEKMIMENVNNFVSSVDTKEITQKDIESFKTTQQDILNKYTSISDIDKMNITNRMDDIINKVSVSNTTPNI